MRRFRKAKIVATLGPSSSSSQMISDLFFAGVDVFRLNFSHGSHDVHAQTVSMIRTLEKKAGRPIGILMDLQGPKLRIGEFANHRITLKPFSGLIGMRRPEMKPASPFFILNYIPAWKKMRISFWMMENSGYGSCPGGQTLSIRK